MADSRELSYAVIDKIEETREAKGKNMITQLLSLLVGFSGGVIAHTYNSPILDIFGTGASIFSVIEIIKGARINGELNKRIKSLQRFLENIQ